MNITYGFDTDEDIFDKSSSSEGGGFKFQEFPGLMGTSWIHKADTPEDDDLDWEYYFYSELELEKKSGPRGMVYAPKKDPDVIKTTFTSFTVGSVGSEERMSPMLFRVPVHPRWGIDDRTIVSSMMPSPNSGGRGRPPSSDPSITHAWVIGKKKYVSQTMLKNGAQDSPMMPTIIYASRPEIESIVREINDLSSDRDFPIIGTPWRIFYTKDKHGNKELNVTVGRGDYQDMNHDDLFVEGKKKNGTKLMLHLTSLRGHYESWIMERGWVCDETVDADGNVKRSNWHMSGVTQNRPISEILARKGEDEDRANRISEVRRLDKESKSHGDKRAKKAAKRAAKEAKKKKARTASPLDMSIEELREQVQKRRGFEAPLGMTKKDLLLMLDI